MPYSRVTSKGQVTIPRAVREVLRVEPGDRVAFRVLEDRSVVVEPETVDLLELAGSVHGGGRHLTVEEMGRIVQDAAGGRSVP